MNENIMFQVLDAIYYELYLKGFLNPFYFQNIEIAKHKIYYDFNHWLSLNALDFNFDCLVGIFRFIPNIKSQYETTRYSKANRSGHSKTILYDRCPKLLQQNQISHYEIENLKQPIRFEIKLRKENCKYMNITNLNNNYHNLIFFTWTQYLAKIVTKYLPQLATLNSQINEMTNPYLFYLLTFQYSNNPATQNPKSLQKTPKTGRW